MTLSATPAFKPWIFVHLPKTAGTSILTSLPPDGGYRSRICHQTAEQIKHEVGAEFWKLAYTFTIVRNPFARWASWYLKHIDNTDFDDPDEFEDWLEASKYPTQSELLGDVDLDFVGRFETLWFDYAKIVDALGFSRCALQWKNASDWPGDRDDYTPIYTEKARKLVEERDGADLERWGYRFEEC